MAIIEVNNLTKEYRLGHMASVKQTFMNGITRLRGQGIKERERFLALNDVNFSIEQGEVVGIIGHNGAGKSTLLKHLASITKPTAGSIKVRGSVAPLIEVGAGVNPELTGRENIFLNGAILGIPKHTIRKKLDEIIAFSELEQFIDTPVKRYSSGMTVKLGFSIATSLDADILIIDEVLAVGDLAFQRKCFDRMENLINKQGKTVLLVSHNIRQVVRMCSRVILMDKGQVILDGDPNDVCTRFYDENNEKIYKNASNSCRDSLENEKINFIKLETIDDKGSAVTGIESGAPLRARLRFDVKQRINNAEIVVGTHTTDFIYLTASTTDHNSTELNLNRGAYELLFEHKSFPLKPGAYAFRVVIFDQNRNPIFLQENLNFFTVHSNANEAKSPPLRLIDIPCQIRIKNIKNKSESIEAT